MAREISLRTIYFEEFQIAFNAATGITKADEGKAVALDTSGGNKVKLAGAGDAVFGRLEVVEERLSGTIATVAVKFCDRLPVATGATFVVGDTAVGAGDGEVKPRVDGEDAKEADPNANQVVEVGEGFVTVLKI